MKHPVIVLPVLASLTATCFAGSAATRKTPPYVPPLSKSAPSSPASGSSSPQNVTPAEAEKLLADRKDLIVLDVRTPEEFAAGHLAAAKNIDFLDATFAGKVAALEGKPLLVHCAAGGRSAKALMLLDPKKYSQIFHLNGGYKAWTEAGKPVTSGSAK